MRIIAGKHRGRALIAPAGREVRPTSSRARESLFNILAHSGLGPDGGSPLQDARVLDAFAGTGALGLEALSRGAAFVTFMDTHTAAMEAIAENLRAMKEQPNAALVRADATRPPPARQTCSLVFLDPPYRSGIIPTTLTALKAQGWIAAGAVIACEVASTEDVVPPEAFTLLDQRKYGAAKIVLLQSE
jgi:16S rRNA (guanine966-N2)-methyltransferase